MNSPSKPTGSVPPDDTGTYRLSTDSPLAPEGIQPPPPVKAGFPKKAKPKPPMGTMIGFNALVFVTSVCVMTLELTASRLIGKHVGSSLYTWTSVIGVVLAGITLGNWLGGWLADRFDRARSLAWMYLLGSIACGSVLWLDHLVETMPRPETVSWPAWVLTVVATIFLLPALALGTTSPLVASMALERSTKTGSTVGNVYAWGALGSIVGTFLTGFYLIDVWGTRSIVGLTAGTLAILAVIVAGSRIVFRAGVVMGWMQLLGWTIAIATSTKEAGASAGFVVGRCLSVAESKADAEVTCIRWSIFGEELGDKLHELGLIVRLRDDPLHQYHDESNYSDIAVTNTEIDGRPVKSLRLDKLIHSYYEPDEPTSLHYDYEKVYAAVTKIVASPTADQPLTVSLNGFAEPAEVVDRLPEHVTLDEANQSLRIERPTNEVFEKLQSLAPEAEYWKAIEQLHRETNKPSWGGFSSVSLPTLPDAAVIPRDIGEYVRHDETLGVLIAYRSLGSEARDRLIANTPSGSWYQQLDQLRRGMRKATACFYGGGGFIFPRWFLQEFPGSPRIDVAELDPAVYVVGKAELGMTPELEERIHTTIGDARNFVDDRLRENSKRVAQGQPTIIYDFIYADAFNDFSIPWHLTTREFLQKTHDLLSDRGVFQANIIDIYPRVEYPGKSVGVAEVEYQGRLPEGILPDRPIRDKSVKAVKKFAPLEVSEILTNRFRLRVSRTVSSREEKQLIDVTWPAVKPANDLELTRGFQPEINETLEKSDWQDAIAQLALQSRKRQAFEGAIPGSLNVTGRTLEGWTSAFPPFEFVEAYRIGEDRHVLGFRGEVSEDSARQLVELDPQNAQWVEAVRTSAAKSRWRGPGRFMGRYVATAAKVFPNIYLFSTSNKQPDANRDTFVMVCSRKPLDLKSLEETGDWAGVPFAMLETNPGESTPVMSGHMVSVIGLAEGQILTDDFAPVDNLLIPVFDTQE